MTIEEERDAYMARNIELAHDKLTLEHKLHSLKDQYDVLVKRFEMQQEMYWKLQDRHFHVQETLMREVTDRNLYDQSMKPI
jgi:hypothetical protein